MLIVLKLLGIAGIWYIMPIVAGYVEEQIFHMEKKNTVRRYLLGMTGLFALFYAVAWIGILKETTLSALAKVWMIVLAVVALAAVVLLMLKRKEITFFQKIKNHSLQIDGKGMVLGAVALLFLTVGSVVFVPASTEDYTAHSVLTMYTTDTLYEYSPMTGKSKQQMLSIEKEELAQEAKSPFEAYYAVYVAICRINPAKFVHLVLPFLIFPIYFFTYVAWGNYLFPDEKHKRYLFLVLVWLLYATALVAEKGFYFQIFQNGWNGQTLFFCGILPWVVLQLIGEKGEARRLEEYTSAPGIFVYVVSALAGQLLYEKGFFVVTFAWAAVWIMTGIMRWKNGSSI